MSDLTIMTFNIWRSGGRSLDATIEAIRQADADVIGLQECNSDAAEAISEALDVAFATDDSGLVVLSRYPITEVVGRTEDEWGGLGVAIDVGGALFHVFDAHLHWDRFGPYLLHDGASREDVLAEEERMRMGGLRELLAMMDPHIERGMSAFLVGDFNAPSHLDYTDFPWPTSRACEARGLVDVWRALHPESRKDPPFAFDEPGVTWTPIVEEEARGCFDRIDFVHATETGAFVPASVTVLDGRNGPSPWPSDHRAVVARFTLR